MRVIAGSVGGIRLDAPKSLARPSTDRLREALFSILAPRLEGVRVLDLFAGSGALGIEALSRGAASATFVDTDFDAIRAIRGNLERARFAELATVVKRDVFSFLRDVTSPFDLILADPPYAERMGKDLVVDLLQTPCLPDLLGEGALLVIESSRAKPYEISPALQCLKVRRYGKSHLHFLERTGV